MLVPAEDVRVVCGCEADGILESSLAGVDVAVVMVQDVNRCQPMPTSVRWGAFAPSTVAWMSA